MSALIPVLIKFSPYILAGIALIGGLFGFRYSVQKSERIKQREKEIKAVHKADEVKKEVDSLPAGKAREELGKWSR